MFSFILFPPPPYFRRMYVVKRDGRTEAVHFDKITARIRKLCYELNPEFVEPIIVAQKVVVGVYNGVTTSELDDLAAETGGNVFLGPHSTLIFPCYFRMLKKR